MLISQVLTDGRLTHGWLVQDRFPSLILVRGLTSCGMHLKSPMHHDFDLIDRHKHQLSLNARRVC